MFILILKIILKAHLPLFQNIATQMRNAADVNVNYIFQNITHLY